MRNAQIKILNVADNASNTGSAFWVGQVVSASFVPTTGDVSAAGTLKIQGSNDNPENSSSPGAFTPTNWADIPNATSVIASGVGPAIVVGSMCFAYVRAVYTRTSGGTTTLVVNMNVLGC